MFGNVFTFQRMWPWSEISTVLYGVWEGIGEKFMIKLREEKILICNSLKP